MTALLPSEKIQYPGIISPLLLPVETNDRMPALLQSEKETVSRY